MKIISLTAENIKKLRAVEIKPTGEIVTISGKNGQGKTSILDSIWWALAGTSHIQGQPIRKGETKARIKLDLGELVVERRFTEGTSTLTVESAEGARFPSPQKMLDALLGELSFDPLAFARMEPRKQFDELRRVAKLEIDVDKLDAINKGDFAKRADVNRDAKAKRAQADAISVAPGTPEKPVDEDALLNDIEAAGTHNTSIETRKANREAAKAAAVLARRQAGEKTARAASVREEANVVYNRAGIEADDAYKRAKDAAADALKRALSQADADDKAADAAIADAAEYEKRLASAPALPEPIDVSVLRVKLTAARAANAMVTRREQEAVAAEAIAAEFTAAMAAREKTKQDAIAAATMPVEGLGFGEGEVTYNGIPFDQASSAEQLRVSLGIAMAMNPKLRIIRILDGSLLDVDSMRIVSEMAKSQDFQVWCEVVDSTGKLGIVIDDGSVVSSAAEGQTA